MQLHAPLLASFRHDRQAGGNAALGAQESGHRAAQRRIALDHISFKPPIRPIGRAHNSTLAAQPLRACQLRLHPRQRFISRPARAQRRQDGDGGGQHSAGAAGPDSPLPGRESLRQAQGGAGAARQAAREAGRRVQGQQGTTGGSGASRRRSAALLVLQLVRSLCMGSQQARCRQLWRQGAGGSQSLPRHPTAAASVSRQYPAARARSRACMSGVTGQRGTR